MKKRSGCSQKSHDLSSNDNRSLWRLTTQERSTWKDEEKGWWIIYHQWRIFFALLNPVFVNMWIFLLLSRKMIYFPWNSISGYLAKMQHDFYIQTLHNLYQFSHVERCNRRLSIIRHKQLLKWQLMKWWSVDWEVTSPWLQPDWILSLLFVNFNVFFQIKNSETRPATDTAINLHYLQELLTLISVYLIDFDHQN